MTIRKTGHMDSARSHVQGLLPYVLSDGKSHFPDKDDIDGNFGQYVCDFGKLSDEKNGEHGTAINNNGGIEEYDDGKYYKRYRYLDLARQYNYAKKQIRDGIIVKRVTRDVVVGIDCEGNSKKETKTVWTDRLDIGEIVEPYNYEPINYYGKDSENHRTVANFTQDGNYGFVFTNENDTEPTISGDYAILVGIQRTDDTINPNQKKVYGRTDEDDINSVFWEYPDTAGKIEADCKKWADFGVSMESDPYWSICKDMEGKFIGYLNIPQDIEGNSVPERIAYANIKEWLDWFSKHSKDSCCYEKTIGEDGLANIEDKEWTAHGGDKMLEFLKRNEFLFEEAINNIKGLNTLFLVPVMEYPLLMTEEYRDAGLWTIYDESGLGEYEEIEVNCEESFKPKEKPPMLKADWINLENENIYIESQLQSVRSEVYYSDDNGSLPGLFELDGGYYKCRYRNYWEYKEYNDLTEEEKKELPEYTEVPESASTRFDDEIIRVGQYGEDGTAYYWQINQSYIEVFSIPPPKKCYDDSNAANNTECYYAATIVEEAVPILCNLTKGLSGRGPLPITNEGTLIKTFSANLAEGYILYDGEYVQLLAKYKTPLRLPYIKNEVHNLHTDEKGDSFGDYVVDIDPDGEGNITITYIIGGECNENGTPKENNEYGILLQDTYKYEANHSYTCQFEDYPTTISGEYLDFDNSPSTITVENRDLGSMQTDENGEEVFTPKIRVCNRAKVLGLRVMDAVDGSQEGILIKQSEYDSLELPTKTEINIELNRGAAAAFESYFKLSECNTMQDLENYQNNWFNI